jgi:hypothetical protein
VPGSRWSVGRARSRADRRRDAAAPNTGESSSIAEMARRTIAVLERELFDGEPVAQLRGEGALLDARRAGERQDEGGSATGHRGDVEVAAHPAGEVAGDRQTETRARNPLVAGQPVEPLEDASPLVRRDPVAVVPHDEQRDQAVHVALDLDGAAAPA